MHVNMTISSSMFLWIQDISSFQHYKLTLHRTVAHVGEVSWQQYSQSLSKSLVNTKRYKATLTVVHSLTPGNTTRILYSNWLISQRIRKTMTLTLAITSARVRNSGSYSSMKLSRSRHVGKGTSCKHDAIASKAGTTECSQCSPDTFSKGMTSLL